MVCELDLLMCLFLGFHQDIQKEGKTRQEDQAEQAYAQLDQIQD